MAQIKITYVATGSVKRNPRNARAHSELQVKQISDSIRQFGFVIPILVDESNVLIAGEGRLDAALLLGHDKVPVVRVDHLSDDQKRELMLADNRISQNSTWNEAQLKQELAYLSSIEYDPSRLGFTNDELNRLLATADEFVASVTADHSEPLQAHDTPSDWSDPEPAPRPTSTAPKPSDDNYSKFELVMEHTNKSALVEVLDDIREQYMYEKIEDALMHLVRMYHDAE